MVMGFERALDLDPRHFLLLILAHSSLQNLISPALKWSPLLAWTVKSQLEKKRMRILSTSLGSSSFQLQRRTTSFSSLRFYATATATESSSTPLKPKGRSTKHGKSYGSTLNLPRTSFDMRPKPEIREKLYRSRTTDELYRWQVSVSL